MQGQLQAVQNNKRNTSLRVQIDGQWFSAKFSTGLKPADVGQYITATLDANEFPPGSGVMWINEYQFQNAATTPASQAMDQAMAPHHAPPSGEGMHPDQRRNVPRGTPNKDAEIAANGLCHCLRPKDAQEAWDNFTWLYHKFNNWNPEEPPF